MTHESHYRRKYAVALIVLFVVAAAFFPWGRSPVSSARAATDVLIWPVSGQISSPCGWRPSTNSFHEGLDITA
jgi:hypothetical protein